MTTPSPLIERLTAQMEAAMAMPPSRRRRLRRPVLWGAAVAVAAAGTAAATVGFVERGSTVSGVPYELTRADRDGRLCLELRYEGRALPAYGCGEAPTTERPLGLFVVDRRGDQGVAYGLVDRAIARVRVAGVETATEARGGVPGRFFLVRSDWLDRDVTAIGVTESGRELTLSGGGQSNPKPANRAEAAAAGHPSGVAPTVDMPTTATYRGGTITQAEAIARGLSCRLDDDGLACFDSPARIDERPAPSATARPPRRSRAPSGVRDRRSGRDRARGRGRP